MAAPTQVYPYWLSPSPYLTTLRNDGVVTATSIVYLPITYYGPSIPLGSGVYVWGGSTSPASTESASSTSIEPSLTAIPSTSSPSTIPTSSSTSPSSTSITLSSTGASSSSTQPATTSSGSPAPITGASKSFPTDAQLAGIVVGSVMAAIFLCLLFYCCWARKRSPKEVRGYRRSLLPFSSKEKSGLNDDFVIVTPGDISPGEGSPRHSGEEADPFLDRSRFQPLSSGPNSAANSSSQRTHSNLSYTSSGELSIPHFGGDGPRALADQEFGVFDAPRSVNTRSSHTMSDLGTPLERSESPTLGFLGLRHILTPEEQRSHEAPSIIHEVPEPSEDSPLMPPPRLVDTGSPIWQQGSLPLSRRSFQSNRSSIPADAASAMLQTARKINIEEELGMRPRSSVMQASIVPSSSAQEQSHTGWLPALGLGGLANRLTWFTNSSDSQSRRNSYHGIPPSAWNGGNFIDRDVEAGRPLLTAQSQEFRSARGIIGVGIGPGGSRPQSGADSSMNSNRSNTSGNTIYHDAVSELPPPPVVHSSTSSKNGSPVTRQPRLPHISSAPTLVASDILDTPAPTALRSFASSSSMQGTRTSRTGDTTTDSSLASKTGIPFLPPGLTEFAAIPRIWKDTEGTTPSPGSYGAGTPEPIHAILPLHGNRSSVTIDVLEEEPPIVQRAFARILGFHIPPQLLPSVRGAGDRSTFGGPTSPTIIHHPDHSSEVGSLHTNHSRDHLSPVPSRIARSIGSSGSHSKNSSQRSRRTGSSIHSYSGSVSSDGRRRGRLGTTRRDPTPQSPALSALGEQALEPPSPSPPISPLKPAFSPERRSMSPGSPTSPTGVSGMPWAAGLDDAWKPT